MAAKKKNKRPNASMGAAAAIDNDCDNTDVCDNAEANTDTEGECEDDSLERTDTQNKAELEIEPEAELDEGLDIENEAELASGGGAEGETKGSAKVKYAKESFGGKQKRKGNTTAQDAPEQIILTSDEFNQVKQRLEKLTDERDDAVRQAQRLQAEFDNYRKRNSSLAAECREDGVRDTVKQLLPVLDSFERALANADDTPFTQGVKNISRQLNDALSKCGLEEIDAEGKFDPNLHDAVLQDFVEGTESGVITAVLQKGYRVKGKIIRHTMVKVNA